MKVHEQTNLKVIRREWILTDWPCGYTVNNGAMRNVLQLGAAVLPQSAAPDSNWVANHRRHERGGLPNPADIPKTFANPRNSFAVSCDTVNA